MDPVSKTFVNAIRVLPSPPGGAVTCAPNPPRLFGLFNAFKPPFVRFCSGFVQVKTLYRRKRKCPREGLFGGVTSCSRQGEAPLRHSGSVKASSLGGAYQLLFVSRLPLGYSLLSYHSWYHFAVHNTHGQSTLSEVVGSSHV